MDNTGEELSVVISFIFRYSLCDISLQIYEIFRIICGLSRKSFRTDGHFAHAVRGEAKQPLARSVREADGKGLPAGTQADKWEKATSHDPHAHPPPKNKE